MQLLIVNYHYVGMPSYAHAGVNGLRTEEFVRQIDWLEKNSQFLRLEDLEAIAEGQRSAPDRGCLLTFDDGLRCHLEVVAPILRRRGIPAVFFVNTKPLLDRKPVQLHQNHYAWAMLGVDAAIAAAAEVMDQSMDNPPAPDDASEGDVRRHYRYDDLKTARIKHWFNYRLGDRDRDKFTRCLFARVGMPESEFTNLWYLDAEEVGQLHHGNLTVGSHGETHFPLARHSISSAKHELANSRRRLEAALGRKITSVSYPSGNAQAVGAREALLAREVGYRWGFTMERAINHSLAEPLLLARMDCNDLPEVGKAPAFTRTGDIWMGLPGETLARKRYFTEVSQ